MTEHNIHKILNEFETHFKHKRLKTKIDMVQDSLIYIRVLYAKNITIDESNTDPKWNEPDTMDYIKKYGKSTDRSCSVMMRIWIHREEKPFEYPKPWQLTLFKDSIYINPYIMPDYNMAKEFFAARKAMTTCPADLLVSSWNIRLSTRQLITARKIAAETAEQHMQKYMQLKAKTKYNKSYLSDLNSLITAIKDDLNIDTFLTLGPYGSGNKTNDKIYKKTLSSNNDFNHYNSENIT